MASDPLDAQDLNKAVIQSLQETIDAIKAGRWQVEEADGKAWLNPKPRRLVYVLSLRLSYDSMAEHPAQEP